jgi:hypothetical protein
MFDNHTGIQRDALIAYVRSTLELQANYNDVNPNDPVVARELATAVLRGTWNGLADGGVGTLEDDSPEAREWIDNVLDDTDAGEHGLSFNHAYMLHGEDLLDRSHGGFELTERVTVRHRFDGRVMGSGYVVALANELIDHGGPESGPEEPVPTDVLHVCLTDPETGYVSLKGRTLHVLPEDAVPVDDYGFEPTALAIEATQFMPDDVDPRLSEPQEPRGRTGLAASREQCFVVQRRYVRATDASHNSSMEVGIWGDVLTGSDEAGMRKSFEWGARGGTTEDGVVVPALARQLACDERLVRVVQRKTVEVLDEELLEPRRVIELYESPVNGRWLIRRYETVGRRAEVLMRGSAGELDAIQLDGVGLSPVYESDELDTLKDWIDGKPERVPPCQCASGVRVKAQYGNVHSDEERR